MCLAIPGKVEEISRGRSRIGRVNFWRHRQARCLDYVPEVQVGRLYHCPVGFALSKIDEETALKTLEDFRAMGMLTRSGREERPLRERPLRQQSSARMEAAPQNE